MRERIVPDASVALKWFLVEPGSAAAHRVRSRDDVAFHVPDLWYLELGNALWKRVRRGELREADLPLRLRGIAAVPVTVHGAAGLLERAVSIAVAAGVSVYDASYAAVAEGSSGRLLTADRLLFPKLEAWPERSFDVELLSEKEDTEAMAAYEEGASRYRNALRKLGE